MEESETQNPAGANITEKNVKADGEIFVPADARGVRAVIVLVERWPGTDRGVYDTGGRRLSDAEASHLWVASRAPTQMTVISRSDGFATRRGADCRRPANVPFFT